MNLLKNKLHFDGIRNNDNGHHSDPVNCRQDAITNKFIRNIQHYEFDNIYIFNEKKTNHQELFYKKSDSIMTTSINKLYKGKLKIWYHHSVKDHKCISETVPFEIIDVAVKIIEHSDAIENENNEPEMLYYLRDMPQVINQFGYHIDTKNKKCIMVLEWCTGGDLFDYISAHMHPTDHKITTTLRLINIKKIIRWLVDSIDKCHKKDICHLDLKIDNIMLRECYDADLNIDTLRLIDFGAAKFIHDNGMNIEYDYICTSPNYTPPEVINKFYLPLHLRFLENYKLTGINLCKIDIWQIGVIAYILIHGSFPFLSTEKYPKQEHVFRQIGECKYPKFTKEKDIDGNILCDEYGIDFIMGAMCFNPARRYSMADLINHKWLS